MIVERVRATESLLHRLTRATVMEFQENKIIDKNICRRKDRKWERNNLEEIEKLSENKFVRQLYKTASQK